MKRIYGLILIIYTFLLLGLAVRSGTLLAFSLPFLLYLILSLLFGPDEMVFDVTRTISEERSYPGAVIQVRLMITNQGSKLERVYIQDQVPDGLEIIDGYTRVITALKSGESMEIAYSVRAPRGYYAFHQVQVVGRDALGFRVQEKLIPTTGRIFILPELWRLRRIPIRPPQTRVYAGFIPTHRGGPGVEFYGIREYQQGDPLRWINWQVSARRRQTYFVNQFEQERVAEIVIVLDARKQADVKIRDGDSLFEHAVQAAASLTESFIGDGNRVGLLAYGTPYLDWAFPGYGKVQREKIMRTLARATPVDSQVFSSIENLPVRLFHPQTQIILITSLPKGDHEHIARLRARGFSILVISPDPVSFVSDDYRGSESQALALRLARLERTLMIHRMRQARIQVLDWDVNVPLDRAAHQALSRVMPSVSSTRPTI